MGVIVEKIKDITRDTMNDNDRYNAPINRILTIMKDGQILFDSYGLNNVTLYIDGEFSFKVQSSYKSFLPSGGTNLTTLLAGDKIGNFTLGSGQYKIQGVQIWQETSPLNLNFECSLYMIDDAYNDVVAPCKILMNTVLPYEKPNSIGGSLIPPGPNLKSIANSVEDTDVVSILFNKFGNNLSQKSQGLYSLKWGKFHLDNCIITGADPTFSKTLDENGYPTSAKISLDITTMFIPTQEMINECFDGSTSFKY